MGSLIEFEMGAVMAQLTVDHDDRMKTAAVPAWQQVAGQAAAITAVTHDVKIFDRVDRTLSIVGRPPRWQGSIGLRVIIDARAVGIARYCAGRGHVDCQRTNHGSEANQFGRSGRCR